MRQSDTTTTLLLFTSAHFALLIIHPQANMKLSYTIINAFSTSKDGGNPAAVVFLPANPADTAAAASHDIASFYPPSAALQRIATHLALPMTAFLVPLAPTNPLSRNDTAPSDQNRNKTQPQVGTTNHYAVRWFNPSSECWICGHATMALSSYLANHFPRGVDRSNGDIVLEHNELVLETVKYGTVGSVQVLDPWGDDYVTGIDFPQIMDHQEEDTRGETWKVLKKATSLEEGDVLGIRVNSSQVVIEVKGDVDLKAVKVDCEKLVRVAGPSQSRNVRRTPSLTTPQASLDPHYIIPFQIVAQSQTKNGPHVQSRVWGSQKGFRVEDSAVSTICITGLCYSHAIATTVRHYPTPIAMLHLFYHTMLKHTPI